MNTSREIATQHRLLHHACGEIQPSLRPEAAGIVLLDETALCDGRVVRQIVEMPGSGVGDTFAAETTYRTRSITAPVAVDVYVGDALRTLPSANPRSVHACLPP